MKENNLNITKDPITPLLLKMTSPMILGMLGLVAFNMVDTYYVSKLGLEQMAAITLTFPVVMIIGSLAQGIGIGAAALISMAVGEKKHHKVVRYATDSLILGIILVLIFVIVGLFTINPLFKLLGADKDTLPYVTDYMQLWYSGVIFVIIPMIGNSSIRALGDTKTPALIMAVASIANIIFDPILIFGFGPIPAMGIQGAALATVISRAITLIVSLYILIYKQKIISLKNTNVNELLQSFKDLLYIGLPNALTKIMTPLAVGVITGLIATFGTEATAGFGIATRIEMFALLVISALASIFVPLLGQNMGANLFPRVFEIIRKSEIFAILYGLITSIILIIFSKPLAGIFTNNPNVIKFVSTYFYIVPIGYSLQGLFLIYTNTLNVLNKPIESSIISLIRLLFLYVPFALFLSKFIGIYGIWFALNISFLVAVLISKLLINKHLSIYKQSLTS